MWLLTILPIITTIVMFLFSSFLSFFSMVTHKLNTLCCHASCYSFWREGERWAGEKERLREREREVWMWSDAFWQFGIWNWKRRGIIVLIMEGRENCKAQHEHPILFTFVNTFIHMVPSLWPRGNANLPWTPMQTVDGAMKMFGPVCILRCYASSKVWCSELVRTLDFAVLLCLILPYVLLLCAYHLGSSIKYNSCNN